MAGRDSLLGSRAVVQRKGSGQSEKQQPGQNKEQAALLGSRQMKAWSHGLTHRLSLCQI